MGHRPLRRRHIPRTSWARHRCQPAKPVFDRSDRAQSLIEYAVLIALIGVTSIAGLIVLGPSLMTQFIKMAGFITPSA